MFKKIENLTSLSKDYVDTRLDELKLKTVSVLSQTFSSLLTTLLIAGVSMIILVLLGYLLLQWLNAVVGAPWGTVIVAGVWIVILVVLLALRKKLFLDGFVKLLINAMYDGKED